MAGLDFLLPLLPSFATVSPLIAELQKHTVNHIESYLPPQGVQALKTPERMLFKRSVLGCRGLFELVNVPVARLLASSAGKLLFNQQTLQEFLAPVGSLLHFLPTQEMKAPISLEAKW